MAGIKPNLNFWEIIRDNESMFPVSAVSRIQNDEKRKTANFLVLHCNRKDSMELQE